MIIPYLVEILVQVWSTIISSPIQCPQSEIAGEQFKTTFPFIYINCGRGGRDTVDLDIVFLMRSAGCPFTTHFQI